MRFLDTRTGRSGLWTRFRYRSFPETGSRTDRRHESHGSFSTAVMEAVRSIHKAKPIGRFIVVQTALHEGYPAPASEHLSPYPFDGEDWIKIILKTCADLCLNKERCLRYRCSVCPGRSYLRKMVTNVNYGWKHFGEAWKQHCRMVLPWCFMKWRNYARSCMIYTAKRHIRISLPMRLFQVRLELFLSLCRYSCRDAGSGQNVSDDCVNL